MVKINYIIATWDGIQWMNKNNKKSRRPKSVITRHLQENVLKIHLNHLLAHENTLSHITIMQPVNENADNQLKGYYEINDILSKIKVPVDRISCINRGFSYGQWLLALDKYRNDYDYHVLVEDDTVGAIDNFDQELVRIYETTFPDGIGYLCGLACKTKSYPLHAAVSYGIINKKTVEILFKHWNNKPYDELGSIELKKTFPVPCNKPDSIGNGGLCQLDFSMLMTNASIPITDYRKYYSVPFWISSEPNTDTFVEYSENHINKPLIIPTQMITSKNIKYDTKKIF